MRGGNAETKASSKPFACGESGFVTHWLVWGPRNTPYDGQALGEERLRREAIRGRRGRRPQDPELGRPGGYGGPWRYLYPGNNIFVEQSTYHHYLEISEMAGAVELTVPEVMKVKGQLWAAGTVDLWVGERHVAHHESPGYMHPTHMTVTLPLERGANLLSVTCIVLGLRDARFLFGLQLCPPPDGLGVRLPGDHEAGAAIADASRWLSSVRQRGADGLASEGPAPPGASVVRSDTRHLWAPESDAFAFPDGLPGSARVEVQAAGQTLSRTLEFGDNKAVPAIPAPSPADEHRRACIQRTGERPDADDPDYWWTSAAETLPVLARRLLGEPFEVSTETVVTAARTAASRCDCADFILAVLLRMYRLDLLSGEERRAVRKAAVEFRYWDDEPGIDAMCFSGENHTLLFSGCQHIAGLLFADDTFPNSHRTGAEQARIGRARAVKWLDRVEADGFQEFLSSNYAPITAGALMNIVDFADEADLRHRAAAQVDTISRMLAMHCFDGVTAGPQGRVYRGVIHPHTSRAQGMLHYALSHTVPGYDPWVMFVASSPEYVPPGDLAALASQPARRHYRQADVEIVLEKTRGYALSSVQIPASFDAPAAAVPWKLAGLFPGVPGYQQHVWNAALARDCHVFVNHPGETFDLGEARPGYWYGNGTLPRTRQNGGVVLQVYAIGDDHPVRFTHAHWPSDRFDAQEVRSHWTFGDRGGGRVALWCSAGIEPFDDVLCGRELRARAARAAWVCVCAERDRDPDLATFAARCQAMRPAFDSQELELSLRGHAPLTFK